MLNFSTGSSLETNECIEIWKMHYKTCELCLKILLLDLLYVKFLD